MEYLESLQRKVYESWCYSELIQELGKVAGKAELSRREELYLQCLLAGFDLDGIESLMGVSGRTASSFLSETLYEYFQTENFLEDRIKSVQGYPWRTQIKLRGPRCCFVLLDLAGFRQTGGSHGHL